MKSFVVSICLTIALAILIFSALDKKYTAFYNRFPEWTAIAILVVFCIGYVATLYRGITGIGKGQRLFNFLGIGVSLFGLSLFYYGYKMQSGNGKETPGQFSHTLNDIEPMQRTALDSLLKQTGTKASDVITIAYWQMEKNKSDFSVCIQDKNIIALQIKGKDLQDLSPISTFQKLSWLVLENCGLTTIKGLELPILERLYIKNNNITSLDGVENFSKLSWVKLGGNPLKDSAALKSHPNQSLYITD